MQPERHPNLDSLDRYKKELQAEYDRLETEKQHLFQEARERQAQARQAESTPLSHKQPKLGTGNVEVFGRVVIIPDAEAFQDELDLESGRPKTVYVWVMTASGWAYAGPLTVFQSEIQMELDALVTARFGGESEDHIIVAATDYTEASRLFALLSRFEN